jgi:hypothetical protein
MALPPDYGAIAAQRQAAQQFVNEWLCLIAVEAEGKMMVISSYSVS